MKNFRLLLFVIIPVAILACNNRTNNQNRENDRNRANPDTISQGSFFIRFNRADQVTDQEFIKEAASSSLMEIELGRFAQENAMNPRVKKFGAMMVNDHQKASEELKAIASSKNIDVPSEMDEKHQQMVEGVRDERGEDFDKAYMKVMATAHEKDINLYQKQSDEGNDASLKSFASKNLPVLMMHRDSVKAIQNDLK